MKNIVTMTILQKNTDFVFMEKEKKMNCDNCIHYHWYYDYCDKWKCEVDAREVHGCIERRKDGI